MSMSLEAAAQVFREAMRQTVKRYWLWYLIEGVLLVVAGILTTEFIEVRRAYEAAGLRLIASKTRKEWWSGTFLRDYRGVRRD